MIAKLHRVHLHAVPLKLSAVLYFVKDRILIPLVKNPHVVATFAFFIYIYGLSGGNDIRHITDEAVYSHAIAAGVAWITVLLLSIPYRAVIDKKSRPRR